MSWTGDFIISLIFCNVLSTVLCKHHESVVIGQFASPCRGKCVPMEVECNAISDETDCGRQLKCCVDGFDATTIGSDIFEEQSELNINLRPINGSVADMSPESDLTKESDQSFDSFSGTKIVGNPPEEMIFCPGRCIPDEYSHDCFYVIEQEGICDVSEVCCVVNDESIKPQRKIRPERLDSPALTKDLDCPGTCILPAFAIFCTKMSTDYVCPAGSKCCLSQVTRSNSDLHKTETLCSGHCLPSHLLHICHPPYQLFPDTANCKSPMSCCMKVSSATVDSVNKRSFPSNPQVDQISRQQQSQTTRGTGYLTSDGRGQIYRVDASGQTFPLLNLPERHNFKHLYDVQQPEGKASIFEDPLGNLYQQFAFSKHGFTRPTNAEINPEYLKQQFTYSEEFQSPLGRNAFGSPVPESTPEPIVSIPDDRHDVEKTMKDVLIPEEGDSLPEAEFASSEATIKPPCPGSCISSSLKFTCFRDHAVYDGFLCPSESVCCASLKDIDENEEYLQSLSPYFPDSATMTSRTTLRCGIKGSKDITEVNTDVVAGEWCWQVAIINDQNQYICGGSLIDGYWVLTAAHCVTGAARQNQPLFVRAGVHDLTSPTDNAVGQTRRVVSIFVHQSHNSMSLDNDIALLRLHRNFQLNKNVCTVCLPVSGQMPLEDSKCFATGYGFVTKSGSMALKVQEAQLNFVDDMDCIANITDALNTVFILPSSSFCASGQGNGDACQGDSGGPLVCEVDGVYELTGILSWGLSCGSAEVPSIFVKVPLFMSWINQLISASAYL